MLRKVERQLIMIHSFQYYPKNRSIFLVWVKEADGVSDVWKNGKNVQGSIKLDLVAHLKSANSQPYAIKLKNRVLELCEFAEISDSIRILDIGCGIGSDVFRMADTLFNEGRTAIISGIDFNTEVITAHHLYVMQRNLLFPLIFNKWMPLRLFLKMESLMLFLHLVCCISLLKTLLKW